MGQLIRNSHPLEQIISTPTQSKERSHRVPYLITNTLITASELNAFVQYAVALRFRAGGKE